MSKNYGFLPAKIITRDAAGAAGAGESQDFRFSVQISSDGIDSYYTHMADSTLANFEAEAAAGVILLDSHDTDKLGVGYSYGARRVSENGITGVEADFYISRGIEFGGQHSYKTTDDFIRAIESGTIRDVSVGFYGGDFVCDICGEQVFGNTTCPHFPGVEYDINGKRVTATAEVVNAHLAEVSLVFKGANPDAHIMEKYNRMVGDGSLVGKQLNNVRTRFGINAGQNKNGNGEDIMQIPNDVRALLPENGGNDEGELYELVRAQSSEIAELKQRVANAEENAQKAIAERDALTPLADMGRAYKADLVADTIAEGIRAQGESFPEETYRAILENSSIEQLKSIRDSFSAIAKDTLTGTRKTVNEDADGEGTKERKPITPAAHRV